MNQLSWIFRHRLFIGLPVFVGNDWYIWRWLGYYAQRPSRPYRASSVHTCFSSTVSAMRDTKVNMVADSFWVVANRATTAISLCRPPCQSLYKRCIEMESLLFLCSVQYLLRMLEMESSTTFIFVRCLWFFYDHCKSKVTGSFSHPEFSQVTRDNWGLIGQFATSFVLNARIFLSIAKNIFYIFYDPCIIQGEVSFTKKEGNKKTIKKLCCQP